MYQVFNQRHGLIEKSLYFQRILLRSAFRTFRTLRSLVEQNISSRLLYSSPPALYCFVKSEPKPFSLFQSVWSVTFASFAMSDELGAIKSQIQDHLVSLGNYDVISKQLKLRLYESGWFDSVTQAASAELEKQHAEPLNFERLYETLRPQAEKMVPPQVREDVMAKIREYLDSTIE